MDRTVVGMFQRLEDARAALTELHSRGFTKDHTSLIVCDKRTGKPVEKDVDTGSTASGAAVGAGTGAAIGGAAGLIAGLAGLAIPGVGPILGIGWLATALAGAAVGAVAGGLVGALVKAGVPEEEAHVYEEGVRRGYTLVTVRTDVSRVTDAAAILNKHHAVDVDRAAADFKACGWTPPAVKAAATQAPQQTRPAPTAQPRQTITSPAAARTESIEGEQRIPIVEEHLRVGKRQVERSGSVRIYTHVVEQPVEERIELTEERVTIERRPVNRPAGTTDLNQPDRMIEVRETAEEPIVQKDARVVEEVVVKKDTTRRTETVRDTVRKTEVDVQPISGGGGEPRQASGRRLEDFEREWRTNYKTDFADAASYEQCAPAYRYAYQVAQDPRFRGREFDAAERELREQWEREHPGTWDRYRGGIQRAYGRARS